ncbi:glutamate--tRNA ligase [Candidatus Falkowbacteria bacterium RIFOXYB2_FULL_35_7]|uniref:Glutamate--tRNA ligase n=1 Tax=Candidatus Falkowbacteria bacterium RIFOXYC2_FULL_36_12 TaxID=1798002 RepID=A0A1F5SY05_9BACT|nr:MAG: glutamate--tRNA ligase [Candidatus Falkowbacteria bacterium RIFOXYB2_FULL_35_7]OGF31608.1 MAG: glutamate--tRNA ligase [Candidatus Falkowbacteria bacterium RIFOXYC2_FULL_36_12]
MENINLSKVRVRIAPSPTGFVHIGNLRTILYNYLFARHNKGEFIVRIEDTDQSRFVKGAMEDLLKTLEWADIDYEEGPFLNAEGKIEEKGDYGPYTQSKRLDIYKKHIKTLLDKNKAYYCFCSKDRLEKLRNEQKEQKLPPKYDQHCRNLSKDEAQKMINSGEEYVIRFKTPENKDVIFEDAIRGTIKVNTHDVDDFVLVKTDKFPTYHFANIVDDHLMKITHVLRGEEWIASTPKHQLLYEAFGWHPPIFAHLPTILNKQKKKMSKRDGDVSVKDFISQGYLKDALLNFITLLGWNAGTDQEIYTRDEMIKQFSLDNVHKAGAVFDLDKLDWINGVYIRQLDDEKFADLCIPYLCKAKLITQDNDKYVKSETGENIDISFIRRALALEQARIKNINEIADTVKFFFSDKFKYSKDLLVWKKSTKEATKKALALVMDELNKIDENQFKSETIEEKLKMLAQNNNLGNGDVFWPLRVALSGREKSPGPHEMAEVFGKDKTLIRLKDAILKI